MTAYNSIEESANQEKLHFLKLLHTRDSVLKLFVVNITIIYGNHLLTTCWFNITKGSEDFAIREIYSLVRLCGCDGKSLLSINMLVG